MLTLRNITIKIRENEKQEIECEVLQMKISKETFVRVLNTIKEQDKINDKIGKTLELVCDGYVCFNSLLPFPALLIDVLNEAMEIKDKDFISWWIWEDVEKTIFVPNEKGEETKIDVSAPEDFYDFLVSECCSKSNEKSNEKGEETQIDISSPEDLYDFLVSECHSKFPES